MEYQQKEQSVPRLSSNSRPNKTIELMRGEGAAVWDKQGRKYIDLSSQTMNLLLGQCYKPVTEAILRQMLWLTFVDQDFVHALYPQAMQKLSAFLPSPLTVFNFRMSDGSSAVECAIKMVRRQRKRGKVLTFDGIYVGQNVQSLHLRGWGKRRTPVLIGSTEDVLFAPLPRPDFSTSFEAADHENGSAACELIRQWHDELACVLIDPIMISSGVTMGRGMPVLVRAVINEAHQYKVPVVLDECQTFGWVPNGTLSRHFEFDADIVVLGKGIGGGLPLAICVSKPEFDGLEWGDADYTNGGTLAAMAALVATCESLSDPIIRQNVDLATQAIERFGQTLKQQHGTKIATRGIGLICALQVCVDARLEDAIGVAAKISERCLENGVIVRKHLDCLTLKPALTISLDELHQALAILAQCIEIEFKGESRL